MPQKASKPDKVRYFDLDEHDQLDQDQLARGNQPVALSG
jgi:hypothetical protein